MAAKLERAECRVKGWEVMECLGMDRQNGKG
jgi:hypothetical protein